MENPSSSSIQINDRRALDVLLNVSRNVVGTFDLQKILQETVDGASALFAWGTAAIYLLDDLDHARLYATHPELPPDFPDELRRFNLEDHPHLARSIRTAQPILLPDTEKCVLSEGEMAAIEQRRLRSLYFVPLVSGENVLGALTSAYPTRRRPKPPGRPPANSRRLGNRGPGEDRIGGNGGWFSHCERPHPLQTVRPFFPGRAVFFAPKIALFSGWGCRRAFWKIRVLVLFSKFYGIVKIAFLPADRQSFFPACLT